ncbi:uroporphyrinogen-III C-methyltransferase [Candidatus Magnetaquicoccus inordinatus]|uniref:uroporphyrinogen-III C-methyltransferase n=1 Tax=Candidatus Magnetaquicoccus inordinatus TaxID=2496818 RepID=UPI001D0ED293|nr:uroporphyrinogen-III C-methyltransferase [Candidatus Magnetaquicoccus inordinatus]
MSEVQIMVEEHFLPPGTVALVGAGPGDPNLLTVAALKALHTADVVVHDALVSPAILQLIPTGIEVISAGKRGGNPCSTNQADITETLVVLAKAGRRVVRLKGGDPFVFGRGGEEACRLFAEGISFRIIPGLTSGIAGPAYAGIPITHRAVNANVAFITGHESAENSAFREGEDEFSRLDWEAMARTFPVLVLYMAMKNLAQVSKRLMAGGRSADTPVALIQWATTPQQRTLVTSLGRLVEDVEACAMKPPVIIVVGEVVRLREEMSWFADETIRIPGSA